MRVSSPKAIKSIASPEKHPKKDRSSKERSNEIRDRNPSRQFQQQPRIFVEPPAAGAHAARHLVNEDATPGAGVLPSYVHRFGKEVDGAAG